MNYYFFFFLYKYVFLFFSRRFRVCALCYFGFYFSIKLSKLFISRTRLRREKFELGESTIDPKYFGLFRNIQLLVNYQIFSFPEIPASSNNSRIHENFFLSYNYTYLSPYILNQNPMNCYQYYNILNSDYKDNREDVGILKTCSELKIHARIYITKLY